MLHHYLYCLHYIDRQITVVVRKPVECLSLMPLTAEELNYPSFMVSIGAESHKMITRAVKNIGGASEVCPVEVTVYPKRIEFLQIGQVAEFDVYLTSKDSIERIGSVSERQLRWISNKHVVGVQSQLHSSERFWVVVFVCSCVF